MLIAGGLVLGELANPAQQRWWGVHSLTTDTVSGLLVLLITVLVVNQLLNRRQARQRGHAVAAQAAIVAAQGARSAKAVSSVIDGSGDRGAASDGFRTYMMVLLVGAPVLINDPVARHFLEQAQSLGAVLGSTLAAVDKSPHGTTVPDKDLNHAVRVLQDAAAPLLQLLNPQIRDSIQRIGQTAEEWRRAARGQGVRLRRIAWYAAPYAVGVPV